MANQKNDQAGPRAVRLAEDNVTPPSRTPWGGRRIRALKGLPNDDVVGESWELSVEPSFPSRLSDGRRLEALLAGDPEGWLGREAPRRSTALLVKLLDAEAPLSMQIHPSDGFHGLRAGEAGKPESWYVVHAEPGAGVYLGLTADADEASVRARLESGGDLSECVPFVPVAPGDFFVIEAGTPHCVGPGLLLVEPQHVVPGRLGVTYRYWDWGRRYDAAGRLDPLGAPRELHVERALAVTDWSLPRGERLLERVRLRAGVPSTDGAAGCEALAGGAGLASSTLRVARLHGTGELALPDWDVLTALTVLAGRVSIDGVPADAGKTLAVPARGGDRRATLTDAHAILSGVVVAEDG